MVCVVLYQENKGARMKRKSFFLLLGILLSTAANGQSTFGTIVGSVKDPDGAAIIGVKITVTNEGTNIAKQMLADGSGDYEVTHLNPGLYRIAAEFPGFQRHVHEGVNLETGQVLRIDIGMTV